MKIDWFTVVAQLFNFIILVWLMKHFLYKPIHNAIDTREKRIETELADADAKKAEAKIEQDAFQKKNADFDRQYAQEMSKARDEVKAERECLLEKVRKEANDMSNKLQEVQRKDVHNLNKHISAQTQHEVFAIARKALFDLSTVSLEERLSDVFIRRLKEMDSEEKEVLSKAISTATEPTSLISAFELTEVQRVNIQNAMNETFEAEILMRFETAPDLISGIEFSTNGYKIGWNIADYLESMEKGVNALLNVKDKVVN